MGIIDMRDRFDYLIDTRAKFLETFRSIGWEAFARDRGASWGSMLGIFLHVLDDEEGWLQYGARQGSILNGPDRKIPDYHDFDQLSSDNSKVAELTRSYLETLSDNDLSREIMLQLPDGIYRRRISKILEHAAVDELAHVGECICLLWQLDVKPPYIDWLDYRV
jgi:uncharacterized damage-inducible protein DinB